MNIKKLLDDLGIKNLSDMDNDPFIEQLEKNGIYFWTSDKTCDRIAMVGDPIYLQYTRSKH